MYRKPDRSQIIIEEFFMPFGGRLSADNRWVRMARLIPWDLVEDLYAKSFKDENPDGRPPISARIAFGALHIKENENLTDERTVEFIAENPYTQYFLGLLEFRAEPLFDPSLMTYFRRRFSKDDVALINEEMYRRANPTNVVPAAEPENPEPEPEAENTKEESGQDGNTESDKIKPVENNGTLVLDATVGPADIRYPTDLSLLNECRENIERMIDEIWDKTQRIGHKTSYNRNKARKIYLALAKQRKPRKGKIRKVIEAQLDYVKRALESIDKLISEVGESALPAKRLERLNVIREVFRQQTEHFADPNKSIPDRIVSLRQPHVRPIVRGKAGTPVEFGQKMTFSVVDGYTFMDRQSFDNFNEGITLIESAEKFRKRHGHYPKAILADQIYRNSENRAFCREHGIRLSGPKLGRPKASEIEAEREQAYADSCARNIVESRNGIAKRRYGLDLIMAILPETAQTEAAMNVFAMNVAHLLRVLLRLIGIRLNIRILSFFCG